RLFALAAFPDDRDAQRRHYDTACAVTAFLSEHAGGPGELARLCAQSEAPQDWLPALDLPSIAACQRAFDRWLSSP
ncbi:MAG: hypothetical protein D6776_02525, partial [Planctomycetota bacterium]